MTKVKVKRGALNYFRSLARSNNLEIEAYLIGEVVSPTLTVIEKFVYPKKYRSQKITEVQWSTEDYVAINELAGKLGKQIIGTIHSHPNWDSCPSPADYTAHLQERFRILGICSVNNKKTKVRFWVPESSLPCKVTYK